MSTRIRPLAAIFGAAALTLVAACGTQGSSSTGAAAQGGRFTPPDVPMQQSMGATEGSVNILAWPGYAEDGSTDKSIDWVTPFEKKTGCQANVKYFGTSDEAVTLMKTGDYDVVSASGDASLRLVASGDVAPVNTSLIKDYAQIEPFLKDRDWNSVNGQMYGVPHGWGANLLMYRTDQVKPAPTSWGAVFTDASDYKGKVTAYDSPIYIADAALYLKATKPDLKITNPYELNKTQFDAAVALLKGQNGIVGEYWSDYTKAVSALESGNTVIGTEWQVNDNLVNSGTKAKVESIVPSEGSTGWSDTWMVAAKAAHPNCMYQWMNYIISPAANAAVTVYFGEAPVSPQACVEAEKLQAGFCNDFHAADETYFKDVWYWNTPTKTCLDGRGDICTDFDAWTKVWTEVTGG
jgi:putative spermidine/putrescine transport system substrate-binding protein